jgi:hypothetical protein
VGVYRCRWGTPATIIGDRTWTSSPVRFLAAGTGLEPYLAAAAGSVRRTL